MIDNIAAPCEVKQQHVLLCRLTHRGFEFVNRTRLVPLESERHCDHDETLFTTQDRPHCFEDATCNYLRPKAFCGNSTAKAKDSRSQPRTVSSLSEPSFSCSIRTSTSKSCGRIPKLTQDNTIDSNTMGHPPAQSRRQRHPTLRFLRVNHV